MSLRNQLQTKLAGLSGIAEAISVQHADKQLICKLHSSNALACEVDSFRVLCDSLSQASMDDLSNISDALTSRLTYLLEPIGPIEHDSQQCIVQMRSKPPQQDDQGTAYYELTVRRGGELALTRFRKQPGNVRQVIPAVLTREVLLRLAEDFEAVLP